MSTCIAYLPNGNLCRRPATNVDVGRGGMVCADHASDRDARPIHPVTGEEMEYFMAPYLAMLADAELTDDQPWERIDCAARFGA